MTKNRLSENQIQALAEEMGKGGLSGLSPEGIAPALREFWKRRGSSVKLDADDDHLRYIYERLLVSEWNYPAYVCLRDEQTTKHKSEWARREKAAADAPDRKQRIAQPKIIGYRVLSHKSESGLSDEVLKLINLGWQPLGGVAAAAFGVSPIGGNRFVQAMVRYSGGS